MLLQNTKTGRGDVAVARGTATGGQIAIATGGRGATGGANIADRGDGDTDITLATSNGDQIRVETEGFREDQKSVALSINGSLLGDQSAHEMTREGREQIERGIVSALQADARGRPDGFKYVIDSENVNGQLMSGLVSSAYSKAGFSNPEFQNLGSSQYGVVRNGRIVPDTAALNAAEQRSRNRPSASTVNRNQKIRAIEADLNRRGYSLGLSRNSGSTLNNLRVGRFSSFSSETGASSTQSGISGSARLPRGWKPGDRIPSAS